MILKITLIGLFAGVIGTGIGGIISLFFKNKINQYIAFFMGISGGVMLSIVTFDLMKESMDEIGVINTVIFTMIGVLITKYIKEKLNIVGENKFGYLIFLSILLHNLPEGLAIGSSFIAAEKLGVTLAIVIGIHNIPEGLAMALSLVMTKMKSYKVILMTLIAGVPMGVGSLLGASFGRLFEPLIGIFLAIAGGTMIYIVLEEIFPKSKTIYCVIGFLIGFIIVNFI